MKLSPLFTWRSALMDSDLPALARYVGLALSLHMSERGDSCFPGQTRLSRETGLSRRTVQRMLHVLRDGDFLCITPSGTRATNDYVATFPGQKGVRQTPVIHNGRQSDAGGASHRRIRGVTVTHKDDSYHDSEDVGASAKGTEGMEQFKDVMRNLSERKVMG